MKIDGIASVNDAVGDGGAVHDASEHIDEDGFDPEYKIKRLSVTVWQAPAILSFQIENDKLSTKNR